MSEDVPDIITDFTGPAATGKCACGENTYRAETSCYECQRRAADRERQMRRALAAARSTVPARYHWARFAAPELVDRVHDRQAIAKARAALKAERVVLLGPAGVGKTVLATALTWARAGDGFTVHFVDAMRLAVARSQHALGEGEPAEVREAMAADFLVLDDLGSERQIATSALPDVLFERHAEMRPFVVTSGFSVEELKARYGDGIARRIFEDAVVISVRPRGTK